MKWTSHLKRRTEPAIARAKAANERIIERALAVQDVDTDDGVFSHNVKILRPKLATRSGFAGVVVTEWNPTAVG